MTTPNNNATSMWAAGALFGISSLLFWRYHLKPPEDDEDDSSMIHFSILKYFKKDLVLSENSTVEQANQRRTISYYEKFRESYSVESYVPEVDNLSELIRLRKQEVLHLQRHARDGTKSHRTVIVMCDDYTSQLLEKARQLILSPLYYTERIQTRGVWIPSMNMIPPGDMHVTVATPWWWHTLRENNQELSQLVCNRLKQTLILKFHYPFQIELERIVLLGGRTLVALWRCVGHRKIENTHIYDRHGQEVDPFVRLRQEIVRCFTTESPDSRRQPLTYEHRKSSLANKVMEPDTPPPQNLEKRQATIELKTPGVSSGDGFIHTTLCRLPQALSMEVVDLAQVHKLCREASATLSGHRMVISKYRFLETTGKGGESNPCVEPIFDVTIDAPTPVIKMDGTIQEINNLHIPKDLESNQTIGPVRNFVRPPLEGLFEKEQQFGED